MLSMALWVAENSHLALVTCLRTAASHIAAEKSYVLCCCCRGAHFQLLNSISVQSACISICSQAILDLCLILKALCSQQSLSGQTQGY